MSLSWQEDLTASITASEVVDESYVQYTIRVHYRPADEPERTWTIVRRYSDFVDLHKALTSAAPSGAVPALPPKRFFNRFEPSFLAQRQEALQRLLDTLANSGAPMADGAADAALALFLEAEEHLWGGGADAFGEVGAHARALRSNRARALSRPFARSRGSRRLSFLSSARTLACRAGA